MALNKLLLQLFCFKNKDTKKKGVVLVPLLVFLFPTSGSAVSPVDAGYSGLNNF